MMLLHAMSSGVRLETAFSRNGNAYDLNILLRLLFVYFGILDFVNNIHPSNRSSEDGMLVVKPGLHTCHSQRTASS